MPWRTARLGAIPTSLQPAPLSKPHQNGVERARFQPRPAAEVVAIVPRGRRRKQCLQQSNCLSRHPNGSQHAHKSTYVELPLSTILLPGFCERSSRPKRPGFILRAALWRAGSRSGGIVARPQDNSVHGERHSFLPVLPALIAEPFYTLRQPSEFLVLTPFWRRRCATTSRISS